MINFALIWLTPGFVVGIFFFFWPHYFWAIEVTLPDRIWTMIVSILFGPFSIGTAAVSIWAHNDQK